MENKDLPPFAFNGGLDYDKKRESKWTESSSPLMKLERSWPKNAGQPF
jgi:hypothetical protein